jgi:hypothetical protein
VSDEDLASINLVLYDHDTVDLSIERQSAERRPIRRVVAPSQELNNSTFSITYEGVWSEDAKAAVDYATSIWGAYLSSPVPIRIKVKWATEDPGFVTYTSLRVVRNFSGAPKSNTWYPTALANSLTGHDTEPNRVDITVEFNQDVDWYYGIDRNPSSSQQDLVSWVLKSIGHGIGFVGTMWVLDDGTGTWGYDGDPIIYDLYAVNGTGQYLTDETIFPKKSPELAAQLASNNIFFEGQHSAAANGGLRPKLYAPDPWSNSSLENLDEETYPTGNSNSLMTPFISHGEAIHDPGPTAIGVLEDLGWTVNKRIISGRVIGFDGKPLDHALVILTGSHFAGVDVADEDGRFTFENLLDGGYFVNVATQEVFTIEPPVSERVYVPPGNQGLIFKETATLPSCEEIVNGIQVCDSGEQHTAIINLENDDIRIELAKNPANPGNGLFKLQSVEELVSGYSSAGTDNDKILHPYLAINGTGFSESNEVSDSERYISKNSILSIDGKPYGFDCGTDAAPPENCFHNEVPSDELYYLSTSFMTYSANGVPEAWVHRASVDFAEEPRDYMADREYYYDTTKIADFAVGYQSTLLDAQPSGEQDGDNILGFEEYVANPGDHRNRKAKTAIGVSCDGTKLFLSTVIPKLRVTQANTSTAKWMRDLQKQGACRVIMLDGGGSPQFSGRGENDKSIDVHAWHDSSICFWCPRPVINAIVAYNDSISLIKNQALSPEGGTFYPSPQVTIHFAANSFDVPVVVSYAPAVRTDFADLLDVGVIYRLEASHQTNVEESNELDNIQPNKPYQVVLQYSQDNVAPNADESKLALYFWNGTDWEIEPTSVVDTANNTVTAHPERFGKWALLTNPIYHNYLPIIQR